MRLRKVIGVTVLVDKTREFMLDCGHRERRGAEVNSAIRQLLCSRCNAKAERERQAKAGAR